MTWFWRAVKVKKIVKGHLRKLKSFLSHVSCTTTGWHYEECAWVGWCGWKNIIENFVRVWVAVLRYFSVGVMWHSASFLCGKSGDNQGCWINKNMVVDW